MTKKIIPQTNRNKPQDKQKHGTRQIGTYHRTNIDTPLDNQVCSTRQEEHTTGQTWINHKTNGNALQDKEEHTTGQTGMFHKTRGTHHRTNLNKPQENGNALQNKEEHTTGQTGTHQKTDMKRRGCRLNSSENLKDFLICKIRKSIKLP